LLVAVAISNAGCGSGKSPSASADGPQGLPLELGALNQLCTKLPSQWHDPRYQRLRRIRLRQADALIMTLARAPNATVTATYEDSDTGKTVRAKMSVRRLAREQLRLYDAARYCERRATPPGAANAGRERIASIKRMLQRAAQK
jgi:hypothetical protein